jgi:hypothetical protein
VFQSDEDGAYIDYCFTSIDKYNDFKVVEIQLEDIGTYNKVFSYVDKSTAVSICYSDFESEFYDGGTDPYLKDVNIPNWMLRNKSTGELVHALEMILNNNIFSDEYINPEEWRGNILFVVERLTPEAIFHELIHATQLILKQLNGYSYNHVKMEIEARLILFYSIFKKANIEVINNVDLMNSELEKYYGENFWVDLYPLTGYMYEDNENGVNFDYDQVVLTKYPSIESRYNLVRSYFEGDRDQDIITDFNLYMLDYQRWLYEIRGYDRVWSADAHAERDFNYYLLNKLENETLLYNE